MPTGRKPAKALSSNTNSQERLELAKTNTCSLVILDDQGGAIMEVMKDDIAPCLRQQMKHHEPIVCYCLDMGWGKSSVDVLDNKAPTLARTNYVEPVVCIGFDVYNGQPTHETTMSITGSASDTHHIPVVCIEGNGSRPSHLGGGYRLSDEMFTLNATEVHAVAYGISSFSSCAFKSSNPHSGIYEAETTRTLDLNGGNPACNQGGMAIVECKTFFFDHHPQDSRVTYEPETANSVSAQYGTGGGNTPIVVEVKNDNRHSYREEILRMG